MDYDKTRFTKFEADENLFARTYNGVPYWQMLRFIVCEGAYSSQIEVEDTVKRAGRKKQIFSLLWRLPYAYVRNCIKFQKLKKCDVVCFCDAKKHQLSRFFDYWEMPPTVTVLRISEQIQADEFEKSEYYESINPYFKGHCSYYLKKMLRKTRIDPREHTYLQELETKIRTKFGRALSAQRMEYEILHWLDMDKAYKAFYEKFFSKVSCKAIVVEQYYQNHLYAAFRVARKKGIRVIELQHGVISNHQEYWFDDQRGLNNYTPDYFLTFGDIHTSWTKLLSATKAVSVGFPYQEAQLQKLDELKTEERTVVVYPNPLHEFETVIDEFADIAVKRGYHVILKIHPLEAVDFKRHYPLLAQNQSIEVVTAQDKGIYYWLKLAKYHIMANTTVGLEAAAFGHTDICIATCVPHQQTQPLLDWNVARGFNTAKELMALIENPLQTDKAKAKAALWKRNAAKNIETFFREMQEQGWPESSAYIKGDW